MLVVIYQGSYPPESLTAGSRRVRDLANGLAYEGEQVVFVAPRHHQTSSRIDLEDHFEVVHLGSTEKRSGVIARHAYWNACKFLLSNTLPRGVLFYDTTVDSLPLMRHCRYLGAKVMYELCDMHSTTRHSPGKRFMYLIGERLLPRNADLNIGITKAIVSHFSRWAPNSDSLLIPGLADRLTFQQDSKVSFRKSFDVPEGRFVMLYNGGWTRDKGIETVLHAVEEVKQIAPLLVVTGRYGGLRQQIDAVKIANKLGLEDYVLFPGVLSEDMLGSLIKESDIVVSASEPVRFSKFAFPTKLAEFAILGAAIVTSDVGDVGEYFRDRETALFFSSGSKESLASAMKEAHASPLMLRSLRRNVQEMADSNFCPRLAGRKIIDWLASKHLTARS